jgi:hypothetical protein
MRTWFNALPPRHHADAASLKQLTHEQPPHAKKRVPMPGGSEAPYALANETGCPGGISCLPDGGRLTLEGVRGQGAGSDPDISLSVHHRDFKVADAHVSATFLHGMSVDVARQSTDHTVG